MLSDLVSTEDSTSLQTGYSTLFAYAKIWFMLMLMLRYCEKSTVYDRKRDLRRSVSLLRFAYLVAQEVGVGCSVDHRDAGRVLLDYRT